MRFWMSPIYDEPPVATDPKTIGGEDAVRFHADLEESARGTVRPVARAVELRVADSGPGIPEEDRLKVFDRFYRSITARSTPGSGLGLAIVKQVVDNHGGVIVADESDDGGALIRVVLPGWMPSGTALTELPDEWIAD